MCRLYTLPLVAHKYTDIGKFVKSIIGGSWEIPFKVSVIQKPTAFVNFHPDQKHGLLLHERNAFFPLCKPLQSDRSLFDGRLEWCWEHILALRVFFLSHEQNFAASKGNRCHQHGFHV
jgi:hypothetical protein